MTVNGRNVSPGREPLEIGQHHLDHEAPARLEVRGRVLEARDLRVLRGQVHDRVEDEVGDREASLDRRRREVADRDADRLGARLGLQPRDHRLREVDAADADATLRERQGDPAGADPELERRAVTCEPGDEIDDRVDCAGLRHLVVRVVVPSCDVLAEVVPGHRSTLPERRRLLLPY